MPTLVPDDMLPDSPTELTPVPQDMLPAAGSAVPESAMKLTDRINLINDRLGLPNGTSLRQLTQESGLNLRAYNRRSKAAGLAQVIPATQRSLEERFGKPLDPYNLDDSLLMYEEVMRENLQKFKNPADALRAYNSGWVPEKWDNPETNDYVQKILFTPQTEGAKPKPNTVKQLVSSTAKLADLAIDIGVLPVSYVGATIAGLTSDEKGAFDSKRAKEVKDDIQQRLSLDVQLQKLGLAEDNPEVVTSLLNTVLGKPAEVIADQFADQGTFTHDLIRDTALVGIPVAGYKGLRAFENTRTKVTRTPPLDVSNPLAEPSLGTPKPEAPKPKYVLKDGKPVLKDTTAPVAPPIATPKTPEGVPIPKALIDKHAAEKAQVDAILESSKKVEESLTNVINTLEGKIGGTVDNGKLPPVNKDLYTGTIIPDDPLVANLKPQVHDTLSKAAIDFFDKRPELYTVGATVADNMVAAIKRGDIGDAELIRYGLNKTELINAFDKSITESAQRMAFHSHVSRAMNLTPEQNNFLKAQGYTVDDAAIIKPFLERADRFRRSMMISQVSTAVGNAVSATARIGFDVMKTPLDAAIQKTFGLPRTVEPLDGLKQFVGIVKQNPQTVENILHSFPKQHDRMFAMFYGDLLDQQSVMNSPTLSVADKVAHMATWANRLQEKTIRSGVFQSQLEFELRNRGYDFRKVVRDYDLKDQSFPTFKAFKNDPKFLAAFEDATKVSVDKALELTYATRPPFGSVASHLSAVINKLPFLATSVIPFPNYLYNAFKYTLDYNPLGVLQYLSKAERAKFMAGDTNVISRAMVGTAMLGIAMQVANSEYGEGKFYELTLQDGRRIDLRPYGTLLVPYLFAAQVMKKSKEGTLHTLSSKDVMDGIAGVNFRGGTGLDVMDSFLSGFTNQGANFKDKREQFAKEYVGNLTSGYFTPFQQLRDIYDQFTEGSTTVRDTKVDNPLLDPIQTKMPMLSQLLKPAALPTRDGPLVIQDPLLKQALSIRLSPPYNDAEKELLKHGFTYANLYPKGLDRGLAYEYSLKMGPLVENIVGSVVRTDTYKKASPAVQAIMIDKTLAALRQPVLMSAIAERPIDEQVQILLNMEQKRIKNYLKEQGIMK